MKSPSHPPCIQLSEADWGLVLQTQAAASVLLGCRERLFPMFPSECLLRTVRSSSKLHHIFGVLISGIDCMEHLHYSPGLCSIIKRRVSHDPSLPFSHIYLFWNHKEDGYSFY
jgi:hypothetical protein